MHRRKTSREEDTNDFKFPRSQTPPGGLANGMDGVNGVNGHANLELPPSPSRTRVVSSPSTNGMPSYLDPPPSAGHQRTTFGAPRPLSMVNGSSLPPRRHQPPAMRQSLSLPGNSHSRARSISDGPPTGKLPASATAPEMRTKENGIGPSPSMSSQAHARRHSRIHSRNLSVFFPRPGTLPSTAIAEDGAQEIAYGGPPEGVPMPSASPGPGNREFRQGFSFGGRAPLSAPVHPMPSMGPSSSNGNSRRGHHHKHSLSHSFFSFLEPGTNQDELHTTPAPVPVSPWMPISPFPHETYADEKHAPLLNGHATRDQSAPEKVRALPKIAPEAVGVAVTEFLLGVWLWITAQQVGSLACTGLGYWIVFDAFGVALGHIVPGYLASPSMQAQYRRPFGNARLETVVAFAQSVYLIFASVYVCKETVEHLLLSSGEGHHHHNGDEVQEFFGVDFPFWLLLITLASLLTTTFGFNNHSKLVSTAGNHIPPLTTYLPSRYRYFASSLTYPPRLMNLLTNPYTLAPIVFCMVLLVGPSFIPPWQHRFFDLVLAGFETVATFSIAYSAAVALGAVLLQTSPARGLAGGRMEAFLRAMREIERHPQVVHLPAPHIWQLTPNLTLPQEHWMYAHHPVSAIDTKAQGPAQSLVVTLELHVRQDLDDDQVLGLTKWAWERCSHALHFGSRGGEGGEAEAEVTVGIVRE
ncbi:uncharacterized protein B0H18DRAFT_1082772 [Fomitopsis serialis]|uniref:uncharacterized protein n=1 Tax=Fomitopsis serialis TaxID=139415 RepID=UPI0020078AA6|nr:uncharacterized protein B0H18DRAFT_1082772 [Neoantrodia serialis]KAH9934154.1 hypothetical protein B0H18DRAFT_1082772 [Neoantrodia serialis]